MIKRIIRCGEMQAVMYSNWLCLLAKYLPNHWAHVNDAILKCLLVVRLLDSTSSSINFYRRRANAWGGSSWESLASHSGGCFKAWSATQRVTGTPPAEPTFSESLFSEQTAENPGDVRGLRWFCWFWSGLFPKGSPRQDSASSSSFSPPPVCRDRIDASVWPRTRTSCRNLEPHAQKVLLVWFKQIDLWAGGTLQS